jgi:hypothetical protein
MGKEMFYGQLLLLLRWEVFLSRDILTGRVMLIKWLACGAFYPDVLGGEKVLTGDVLNKFCCIIVFVFHASYMFLCLFPDTYNNRVESLEIWGRRFCFLLLTVTLTLENQKVGDLITFRFGGGVKAKKHVIAAEKTIVIAVQSRLLSPSGCTICVHVSRKLHHFFKKIVDTSHSKKNSF